MRFELLPGSYQVGETSVNYPAQFVRTTTDGAGKFAIALWCNEEGQIESVYSCSIQGDGYSDRFEFTIPPAIADDSPEIDITELRARGVEPFATPTPPKPTYRQTFLPNSGQVNFALSAMPAFPHLSRLWINGVNYNYGVDYLIDGFVLTWLDPIRLEPSDFLEILY